MAADYGDFLSSSRPMFWPAASWRSAKFNIGDHIEIGVAAPHQRHLNSGGDEDQAIVAPLHIAQVILHQPNAAA
jgi:hypothetical protein